MKNEKLPALRGTQKHAAPRKSDGASTKTVDVAKILGGAPTTTAPTRLVPAKWRWHYRVLLALQGRLIGERGELLQASAQSLEPHSMDEADSATDEFDHDLALTQLSAEQNALYEVNDALERILAGRYGVCQETGQAIPAPRLRAVPWTRFTYAVAERLETKGAVRRGLNKPASVRGQGQIRLASEEEAQEGEKPSALANDETLSHVFSPKAQQAPLQKIATAPFKATKPKRRNT
jgi:RNA polymerase-binding transcription factor DksA